MACDNCAAKTAALEAEHELFLSAHRNTMRVAKRIAELNKDLEAAQKQVIELGFYVDKWKDRADGWAKNHQEELEKRVNLEAKLTDLMKRVKQPHRRGIIIGLGRRSGRRGEEEIMKKETIVHKIAFVIGRIEKLCGADSRGGEGSMSWGDVTCRRCLSRKWEDRPEGKKHRASGHKNVRR